MNYINIEGELVTPKTEEMAYAQTNQRMTILKQDIQHDFADVRQEITETANEVENRIGNEMEVLNSRLTSDISSVDGRIDNIIAHNNDTEGNTELIDIRTGADGTVYASAGDAVRGQFRLYSELRDVTVYTANQISNNTGISGVLDNQYLAVNNIPVTKKGKLIVYAYCRFAMGFESVIAAPQKIIVLQKHGTTMTVKAVIPITINTSDADETLGIYQWIKVDTGYHISESGEYYIAAYNGVTYCIEATSREDFVGYYFLSANVAEGVSVNDTFSANDFRTNSGLLCYPEIDGWNTAMKSEVPTKVSELENDLHFTANNNFRSFYWNGKTGNILGDSMTIDNSYTSKLEQMYNMTINNYGVSGTTISTVRDMENYPCFYHRIENMTDEDECDFVFMLGGTNDWGLGCPLGTITDRTPSTFYGALYYTLNLLRTKYPTKPIFVGTILQRNFVAPPPSQPAGIDSNQNDNSVDEFNQAIIYMARRFGCIVIDTWQAGICPEVNGSNFTRDGLHLNAAGGQKLAAYIKNVMEQYPVVNTAEA